MVRNEAIQDNSQRKSVNPKEQSLNQNLNAIHVSSHLQRAVLRARQQLEVMDADGRDDVSFPAGVAGAVRERHFVVALACPQQTQVLSDIYTRRRKVLTAIWQQKA